jgi:hypothetical protein
MPSFITFNPPLDKSVGRIEIHDFILGNFQGKGAGGRGYPGPMRALWLQHVRDAIVEMASNVPTEQILAAEKNGTTFGSVIVYQPNRRVTMQVAKITSFTQYIGEPKKIMLHFQSMMTADLR